MNATSLFALPVPAALRGALAVALTATSLVLAACGGSADAPPPPEPGPAAGVAPTITQQPANLTVTAGQTAAFTVAATGTAPLAYQWQRNGVDIAGATTPTYTTAATVLADSGATYRARVANAFGGATSTSATLTVSASAPVLTITQQPANISVVAGTSASFTVAGTCSSGTLVVQWQRRQGSGQQQTFVDIAGATTLTYTMPSTVLGDSGAQFRVNLSCSGQSAATSNVATLTVTPPGGITLSLLPLVGLRDQADISSSTGIDQDPSGSFTFITGSTIKRLSADLSTITLVAGAPAFGSADGPAATASFNSPFALTHDAAGNIYVADSGNSTIRRIATDGTVSTLAGLAGNAGSVDGTGSAARFDSPVGIAMGPDGDLYVADRNKNQIRRVTTAGVVTTYAGIPSNLGGYLDGPPLTAKFNSPWGVAVAANGDVLIADSSNNRIRRIVRAGNVAGVVETLAGDGTAGAASADGVGVVAVIARPLAIVIRGNRLTLRDAFGLVRQLDLTTAAVSTLTGSRILGTGYADGTSTTARTRDLGYGLTGAANGGFMLADDYAIQLVSATGVVRVIASSRVSSTPQGVGVLAQIPFTLGGTANAVTVDPSANVVVADGALRTVRRINPAGIVTLAAGLAGSFAGAVNGVGSETQLTNAFTAIATDGTGAAYLADGFGSVHKIGTDNATTLFAGSEDISLMGYVDGTATTARFKFVTGLASSAGGVIFVSDRGNNVIRRIDPAGNVTTYAGVAGQSARVDGPIATARFQFLLDVALGPDGALYVLDTTDTVSGFIRKITPDGSSVSTVGQSGQVRKFTIDSTGTIYYEDAAGLWMLTPAGTITLLIPHTSGSTVLGLNPQLNFINAIAMLGPKQIVLVSGAQLLVATLP